MRERDTALAYLQMHWTDRLDVLGDLMLNVNDVHQCSRQQQAAKASVFFPTCTEQCMTCEWPAWYGRRLVYSASMLSGMSINTVPHRKVDTATIIEIMETC